MASHSEKIIIFNLILAIAIPISTSHREIQRRQYEPGKNSEQCLRDLCSKTSRSNDCWKILKSNPHLINASDDRAIAAAVIDLAIAKSGEIHYKINRFYSDSRNDEWKEKYILCSKNYNDINRNLVVARMDLDSGERRNIPVQISDAREELNNCKRKFEKESPDPARIGHRNKEIGLYLEIVKVAADRLFGIK